MDIWHLWSAITSLPAASNTHSPLTLDLTRPQTAQIHNFWSHIFKRWWQKQQQVNRCQTEKKVINSARCISKASIPNTDSEKHGFVHWRTSTSATNETLQMRLLSSCSQVALFYTSCYRVQRPLQVYSPVGAALVLVWPLVAELCSPQRPHCSAFVLLTLQLLHSPQLDDQAGLTWFSPSAVQSLSHLLLPPAGSHALFLQVCDVPTPAVSTRPLNSFSQKEADFFIFLIN